MKISEIQYRNDALDKITRLGLAHIFLEIQNVIFKAESGEPNPEKICGNITESMKELSDWSTSEIAGIDWIKSFKYRKTLIASIGLKICIPEISGMDAFISCLKSGLVDVGIITVLQDSAASVSKETLFNQLNRELEGFTDTPYIIVIIED